MPWRSLPDEPDPNTLETIGRVDFNGGLTGRIFTAHPRIDPLTGNLIAFAYNAGALVSNWIYLYEITPEGRVIREERFEAPYSSMIHDFLVSRKSRSGHRRACALLPRRACLRRGTRVRAEGR